MFKSLKFSVLIFCLVFLAAGTSLAKAQAQVSGDSIDQKVAQLQKEIDAKGYHWIAQRNWTSELSDEEFDKLLGFKPPKGYYEWLAKQPKLRAKVGIEFPPVFDWRDSSIVTPVKNQGSCGSCWAFAATGAFEAAIKKHDGIEYDLSEQQVVSCNVYVENGCDGGWAETAYELFQRHGAILESAMPYQASGTVPCTQDLYPVVAKLKSWQYVDNDVNAIKAAILIGPVYSGFSVYHDFDSYSSGCYQHTSGYYRGEHAIVIVGWDDNACGTGQGAWICKNSWGANWGGLHGYFYIKWGDCGIGGSTVLPIYPPDPVTLVYDSHQATESIGNADGILDPGETVNLPVTLKNTGPNTATGVSAILSTSTPGINIINPSATFPSIASGATQVSESPSFSFQIDPSVERGTRADFNLAINSDQGSFTSSLFTLIGKMDTVFFDNMEAGDNGWTHGFITLLDDWQHGTPTGGCKTDPSSAYSGTKVWGNNLSGSYSDQEEDYLLSPVINCGRYTKTRLQFHRWLSVEKGIFDTAQVLVNGNPLWTNDSMNDNLDMRWVLQDFDISSIADTNPLVQLKYRLRSDEGLHLGGWNIDDVLILGISSYKRGDVNGDNNISVTDVIYFINYLFKGGPTPTPLQAGDANCDGNSTVSDVIFLINYLFKGGPAPAC
ncbi:MAG TPA: C1 family peptidase [Terriglobales bacterium]|nr:C1 family peptidase [Terriglobales bacterium]